MASRTFTIPDAILPRVINGVAYANGYLDNIPNPSNPAQTIPNPETKAEFFLRRTREYWKECVKAYETKLAIETARATIESTVNQDISL